MKRLITLLAISGSLLLLPTTALAKENVAARGYAVITGPRLIHPIVLTAPWDRSRGGYYGNDAENFLHLADSSGAIPAGRDLLPGGGSVPDGVVPLRSRPSSASLGPVYRLTWFRNGVTDVVTQKVYPYASAGPIVYTPPASRQALITLFGRFQDPAHLSTGWGTTTGEDDLLAFLQVRGLPGPGPVAQVTRSAAHAYWLGIGLALAALGAILAATLLIQRRRRNARSRAAIRE
jgi:hypothetical protein